MTAPASQSRSPEAAAAHNAVTGAVRVSLPAGGVVPKFTGPENKAWRLLTTALLSNVPMVLWGLPGIGKSRRIEQVVASMFPGLPLVTVIASLYDPTEFAGLPGLTDDGTTRKFVPEWVRVLIDAGGGVVFFDEISTAMPATQAALMRVVLDRTVGDTVLPDTVRFVCAANPPECAAGGWDLSAPLSNRLMHVDVAAPSPLAWGEWLREELGGAAAPVVHRDCARIVSGFIRRNADALHDLPKTDVERSRAWPSPRSWHMAAKAWIAVMENGGGVPEACEAVTACVGDGVGSDFTTYATAAALPDPAALLDGTEVFAWDATRPDLCDLVGVSVVQEALDRPGTPADRARLVERACELLRAGAAVPGVADVLATAAATVANWRNGPVGRTHPAKGLHESRLMSDLETVTRATIRTGAAMNKASR